MRLVINLFLCLVWVAATSGVAGSAPLASIETWQARVDPGVLEAAAAGETEFIIMLAQQADLSRAVSLKTKQEKGAYVFEALSSLAQRTQGPLLKTLDELGVAYRPYWVANMVWARGGVEAVQAMAQRSDVAYVYANPAVRLAEPDREDAGEGIHSPQAIEWNLLLVNADDVWSQGFTGQGAVIGGQDTGYDWDHPALIQHYRGWDGAIPDHNYNWHDAIHSGGGVCGPSSPEPCDDHGHGTHTMGIVVGDDGGVNRTGMAPGARWIGCRNMDRGVGTPITYAECYQWFIAPTDLGGENPDPSRAPHVINNSWGCPPSEGCTEPDVLLAVVDSVRAAGILTVHSAGNSGPFCSSLSDPAAIYASSFTVGATNNSDVIASFSSRGPVSVDGSDRRKPDISAPGVNVRSSVPGSGYQALSGTSMAAPHVAGLAALLISAEPALAGQVDALETIIERSAAPVNVSPEQICGGISSNQVPNNTYGWGRIDAWAAYQGIFHHLLLDKSVSSSEIEPGGSLTYTLTVSNTHPFSWTTNVVLTDVLPISTSLVSATQPYTLAEWMVAWHLPVLAAGESRSFHLVVQVSPDASGVIENAHYAVRSDEVPEAVRGRPVYTQLKIFLYLPFLIQRP